MGITSVLFIVVLIAVSGLVAWAGDTVGRLMGKRRVALFGIRPRRTSVLIAVATGMLITALTIFALALANETVRETLVRMDRIRREFASLMEERDELIGERERLIEERDQARQAVDSLQSAIAEGREALEQQRGEIELLTGQLTTAQEELATLEDEVEGLQGQARTYEAEIGALVEERDSIQAEYNSMVTAKEEQISRLNEDISDREARVDALNQEMDALNQQLRWMREGKVKVYEGQQLAVFLVDTDLDEATLNTRLVTLLAGIPTVYRDLETGEQVLLDNEVRFAAEDYREAVRQIRAMPSEKAVVIVYAAGNVFEDEQVPLRAEVTSYYKVYPAGTVIYSATYNAPIEAAEPYRAIVAGFLEDARNHLVNERNIIPTSADEVMQLTIDDVLDLASRLSRVGFPAELKMVALADIYRTDFLVYGEQFAVTILPASGTGPE